MRIALNVSNLPAAQHSGQPGIYAGVEGSFFVKLAIPDNDLRVGVGILRIRISATGSPSTRSRSASAPSFITPSSPGFIMISPPQRVAATMASMG